MKIVQSFWSGNKDLLKSSFGWHGPQYHLMAWTLSCLKLREYYDNVQLYTDQDGYNMLIGCLQLPYSKAHVCFDTINNYPPALWAAAKIHTYEMQQEAFIHVDGDVFIWKKFDAELEQASLIAQNLEISTNYYEQMMGAIINDLRFVPDIIKDALNNKPFYAYNAGIFGGSDLVFFKEYTRHARQLITENYIRENTPDPRESFNILFEQILFQSLVQQHQKTVACYFKHTFSDDGYDRNTVADFTGVPGRRQYLHLIGPHKKNRETCELLAAQLRKEYPAYFYKIVRLFPRLPQQEILNRQQYVRLLKTNYPVCEEALTLYEQQLLEITAAWENLDPEILLALEDRFMESSRFFSDQAGQQKEYFLEIHPWCEVIETSFDWTLDLHDTVRQLAPLAQLPDETIYIASIPKLYFDRLFSLRIDATDYNILALLEQKMRFDELLHQIKACFPDHNRAGIDEDITELICGRLKRLYSNRLVFISIK